MRIGRSHIPVLYALLEDKHKTSYQTVLQWLNTRCPLLHPSLALSDFEKAELWAFKMVYPSARIQGCNFHFNQLQLKQFRIISDYHSNEVLRIHLRCVYGLPFIPLTDVIDAWTELKAVIWTCCPTRGVPVAATLNGDPRTNNASEGGNNALKHATTSNNPCIWSFVPTIRAFNSEMEQKLLLLWQNIDPERPQRPRWRSREETIKRLVETYNSADKVGTMRAVGLKLNPP